MTEKTNIARLHFSLTELIVAMGVFSILLVMVLQFFTGAQRICTSSESKNNVYADARVAMNLMANILQSAYYSQDETPFFTDRKNDDNKVVFVTKYPFDFSDKTASGWANSDKLFLVKFYRENDTLKIAAFGSNADSTAFKNVLMWKTLSPTSNYRDVCGIAYTLLNNANASKRDIIDRVVELEFKPAFPSRGSSVFTVKDGDAGDTERRVFGVPMMIEISMRILDRDNYIRYKALKDAGNSGADDVLDENAYTFRRIVYMGDRQSF